MFFLGISFPALTVFTKDAASLSNIMDSMAQTIDSVEVNKKRKHCVLNVENFWKQYPVILCLDLQCKTYSAKPSKPSPLDSFCQQTQKNNIIAK